MVAIEYWKIEVAVFLPLPHPKNKTCVGSPRTLLICIQPHMIDSTEMANTCMNAIDSLSVSLAVANTNHYHHHHLIIHHHVC